MQTFMPTPNFDTNAKILDYKRLGKQRVEAKQILKALEHGGGWSNHPITKMWQGHEECLKAYHNAMIKEWIRRGYKNTMPLLKHEQNYTIPSWIMDEELHLSHKSNLLRKYPEYYGKIPAFKGIPDNLPYKWVVEE